MARYTAVSVYPNVKESLALFAAHASAEAGRRVTLSEAVAIAVAIAADHLDEVANADEQLRTE